jgi:hypothetical protein
MAQNCSGGKRMGGKKELQEFRSCRSSGVRELQELVGGLLREWKTEYRKQKTEFPEGRHVVADFKGLVCLRWVQIQNSDSCILYSVFPFLGEIAP